jgi:hypothetical protein
MYSKFIKQFANFKFFCSGLSIILLVWFSCHLFIRSFGGAFPDRTRGPLAPYRYYKLSDFPEWENVINADQTTGQTSIEDFMNKKSISPLDFGKKSEKVEMPSETKTDPSKEKKK